MGTARMPDRNISHTLFPYNMATACKWTTGLKTFFINTAAAHIKQEKYPVHSSVQIWQQQAVHRNNLMHPLPDKMVENGCEDLKNCSSSLYDGYIQQVAVRITRLYLFLT